MDAKSSERWAAVHRELPEHSRGQLKADLRKADENVWRLAVGRAIQRAVSLRGWSLKEFSAAVNRDERQCSRWLSGSERPQFDVMLSVDSLRQPIVIALAELGGDGVEITTAITIRRIA